MKSDTLKLCPLDLNQANAYVKKNHRHHDPVYRDKYRVGCTCNGQLVGIVQVGRPVSRFLDDGETLEIVRLCTTGQKNVCSFLYSAASRVAKNLGYKKVITYILDSEDGTSLKASGFKKECDTCGHSWSCPSRPRNTTAPKCNKQRWSKTL